MEIHVNTPVEECEKRDPKGLYVKARAGEIPNFTGISAPYEEPKAAELVIESAKYTVDECVEQVIAYLHKEGLLKADA